MIISPCYSTGVHIKPTRNPRTEESQHSMGGGGTNNKKYHAAGQNPRCPLFFFYFLFFFKTRSKSTFLCQFRSNMSSYKNQKKIMISVFFDQIFCSFLFFLPDFVNKMSSNREQKRTEKIMPPGKSQNVLSLFCC